MRIKQLATMLIFILLFINSVSAVADDYTFRQGETVDIKLQCQSSGSPCTTGATCNITVFYPNSSLYVDNQVMQENSYYHNYTLDSSLVIGDYQALTYCTDGINTGSSGFTVKITNETTSTNVLPLVIGIALVIGILLFIAFIVDSKHFILRLLLIIFSFILLILIPRALMVGDATSTIFYKTLVWLLRLFFTYVFVYFIYEVLAARGILPEFRK